MDGLHDTMHELMSLGPAAAFSRVKKQQYEKIDQEMTRIREKANKGEIDFRGIDEQKYMQTHKGFLSGRKE